MDWSRIQVFLAVAETGSLSAAARALGLSQPTVGRHIHALEASMGVELFLRKRQGMELTVAGQALVPPARAMKAAASDLDLCAAGADARLSGTVRVTASVFASHHILPPILSDILTSEPEIAVELVPTDTTENLLFREADIAVRMYRPTQLDVVTRHIVELELGVYGARTYFARRGRPHVPDDLRTHDMVGYDRNETLVHQFKAHGFAVTRDFFRMRCDQQAIYWELVRAGCGLGFAQTGVADEDPAVERVLHDMALPTLPVWLTAPRAVRATPRVARVWEILADGLSRAGRPGGSRG